MSNLGYYVIEGWMKEADSKGFNAKPIGRLYDHPSRSIMRTMFKRHCYECDDPSLIKVMYYRADDAPRNVSRDLSAPEFKKHYPL